MTDKIVKTEEEWRKELTPEQYHVLREKGTERPFTGEYEYTTTPGTYECAACGQELFTSEAKFDSASLNRDPKEKQFPPRRHGGAEKTKADET